MDSLDWNLIRILHETLSMAKAAEILYISSPAVLYRVRKMEKNMVYPYLSKIVKVFLSQVQVCVCSHFLI